MHDKGRVSDYASWLAVIPWQLLATLTFAWRVGDVQAIQVFRGFVDRAERHYRCPLVYVRGDERRFSGCGMPLIRRHFHVLFAAAVSLDPTFVRDIWIQMAGSRKNDAGADVRIYDSDRGGLAYSLKNIFEQDGDWSFANLDLCLPISQAYANARARRRQVRHANRVFQAEHALSHLCPSDVRMEHPHMSLIGAASQVARPCGPARRRTARSECPCAGRPLLCTSIGEKSVADDVDVAATSDSSQSILQTRPLLIIK